MTTRVECFLKIETCVRWGSRELLGVLYFFPLPLQRTGMFASIDKARINFVGFTVTIRFLPVNLRFQFFTYIIFAIRGGTIYKPFRMCS